MKVTLLNPEAVINAFKNIGHFASVQGDAATRTAVVHLILYELLHEVAYGYVLPHRLGGAVHGQLLEFVLLGLGIAAPAAPQVAPLQKHDGADARPVVDGEALNIKNATDAVVVIGHAESFLGERLGLCPKPRLKPFLQKRF